MKNFIFALFALLLFAGCASKTPEVETAIGQSVSDVDTMQVDVDPISKMDTMETISSENIESLSQEAQILRLEKMLHSIYFESDKYYIPMDLQSQVQENADILNNQEVSGFSIKIEGNCDEWGTDEYNYALGLKRAKSAKDALGALGVETSRMALVSYGESKPLCFERNDACWQKNRRVDFKLLP